MLYCAATAAAQGLDGDSASYNYADTASADTASADTALADRAAYNEDEETPAPPRTVIYNTAQPNTSQWRQATGSDAYGYRDQREYVLKAEPPEEIPGWYKFLIRVAEFLGSSLGKTILWAALALIVGYVAYRIIAGQGSGLFGRRDRASAPEETGNVSEQGLLESDWEERLRAALAAGDSRLAIRYSYMHLLQALQERGLIVYRPDKTNAAYYRELTESLRQPFRAISRQYEYTWYGNFLPDPPAMESYMQTYDSLKKSITYA